MYAGTPANNRLSPQLNRCAGGRARPKIKNLGTDGDRLNVWQRILKKEIDRIVLDHGMKLACFGLFLYVSVYEMTSFPSSAFIKPGENCT